MKYSFLILIGSLILFSCSGGENSNEDENKSSSTTENVKPKKSPLQKSIDKYKKEAKENLTPLLQKFTLVEDKVEGGGWYYHKNGNSKYQSHIEVPISTNGYFYLKTNYYGSDWLFHNQIIVNIDGTSYYSSIIENHDDYSVTDVLGGGVLEILHLTDPQLDAHIVSLIFKNQDEEIIVRFKGDQAEKDITLSKADKEVIKDCFLLSQYLTVTKNKKVSKIEDNALKDGFYLIPNGNFPEASIKLKSE